MGKLKTRLADCQVSEYQNIQIQRAGSVANAGGTVAAKLLFNAKQALEQGVRVKAGLKDDDRVEKTRLAGEAHRLGGIKRRASYDVPQRLEARGRRSQRSFRWSHGTGQVCAHSDVGGLHDIKTIAQARDSLDECRRTAWSASISFRRTIRETSAWTR